MATPIAPLRAVFVTELVLILLLMVVNTYFLTRRPILHHLREIYFINSRRFREAWYLVIAGVTFFVVSQVVQTIDEPDAFLQATGRYQIYEVAFATLIILAFGVLLLVFRKYIPYFGADDEEVLQAVRGDVRRNIIDEDTANELEIDVSVGEDIYRARDRLGPMVSLAHYRGVVLGLTQYMEKRLGELGDSMLYAVGRQTGRNAAREIMDERQDAEASLQEFLAALRSGHVGIPEVLQMTPDRVSLRLSECAVCAGMRATGQVECHYLTGAFTGLFEVLYDAPVDAREVKCWARGDTYCEFELHKRQLGSKGL